MPNENDSLVIKAGATYAVRSLIDGKSHRFPVRVLDKVGPYYRAASTGNRGDLYMLRADAFICELELF